MSRPELHPAVLCVCDGWGCAPPSPGNAISLARTPNFDKLFSSWPHTTLAASGRAVGLPPGQQGNSEVGHLTIGAGRIVLQDLTRIDQAIADGSFFANPVLNRVLRQAQERGGRAHVMGLVSTGGVHSHQSHLVALCELARHLGLEELAIHVFTDGRDTPPQSGAADLDLLLGELERVGVGEVASIGGRYFAMDRDRRWDRTELALEAILGRGQTVEDPLRYLRDQYAKGVGDEFIPPAPVVVRDGPGRGIADQDVVIHFNFRPDRARQLCHALVDHTFSAFDRGSLPEVAQLCTFTKFDDTLEADVAFPKPLVPDTLAEVVSAAGARQFHVAETEKYAHVTYFINGGREEPFPREERLLVPSPKVTTYDLAPEMSAAGITDAAVGRLEKDDAALIALNFANADMVGHTGDLAATVAAVEFLDQCLGRLAEASQAAGYLLLLTADHGNAEIKVNPADGSALTQHTTSRVPMILAFCAELEALQDEGGLEDVAPTLLRAMGLAVPSDMTGHDLARAVTG
ncbi:MAG TPA: 2,3-bisphosphoglycerate-independent phosphoglycerate mutase [Candidatus Dormibacteraeota bacterium]